MADLIRVKRGNEANLPPLMTGEFGWCLDTEELYIGGLHGNVMISDQGEKVSSVKDFGAKGDNITNDMPAFVNWLNFIIANEVTGIIPPGTYLLNGVLQPSLAAEVVQSKKWTIRGVSRPTLRFGQDTTYLNCSNFNNVTIENIIIQGTGNAAATRGVAIYGVNINNTTFRDIVMNNISICGVNIFSQTSTIKNKNIIFDNVEINGVPNNEYPYPAGYILNNCTNCSVVNTRINNLRWYGVEFKTGCHDCTAENIIATNCGSVCHLSGNEPVEAEQTYNIRYDNVICRNCGYVIYTGYIHDCTVNNLDAQFDENYSNPYNIPYLIRLESTQNSSFMMNSVGVPSYVNAIFITETVSTFPSKENYVEIRNFNNAGNTTRPYVIDSASTGASTSINNMIVCFNYTSDRAFVLNDQLTGKNIVIDFKTNTRYPAAT